MKYLLLSIICLSIFSQNAFAQSGLLQKHLTFKRDNLSLKEAFEAIEKETGCTFVYSPNLINTDRIVRLNYTNTPLLDILKDLLGDTVKNIEVKGHQINLQPSSGKGNIQGVVHSNDGKPAAFVTVGIRGVKSTQANSEGYFQLENIEAGNHLLIASFVGLQTKRQPVTVKAGETASIDFVMSEDAQTLQEVVINGNFKNKYNTKKSDQVAKLPLANLENPQVYISIPKQLIEEQITTDFGNILKNSPGVYKIQGNRGINSDGATTYTLRGFRTEVSMIDGLPGQANGELDPANVEKIEVLKGPSATLYGGALTSFGGMINVVTKKPIDTLGSQVSFITGSYGLTRLAADVYGPVNKEGNLLVRMNAAYQNQNSFQDAGFRKNTFFAPSIEYRANDRLTLNLDASFYQGEGTSPNVIFLTRTRQYVAHSPEELGFDWNRSYTSNDLVMHTPTINVQGKALYKISDNWTSQTRFSSNKRRSDGYYLYEFIRGTSTDTLIERDLALLNTENLTRNLQQNFTGDFKIGNLRNRLVIGLDFLNQTAGNNNSPYIVVNSVSAINLTDANYTALSKTKVDALLAASTGKPTKTYNTNNVYSAYASDVLNITDRLLAMASLRIDRFDNRGTTNQATDSLIKNSKYAQTALSPKLGLVYQIVKNKVSLFGNYMNGFSNVAPVTQPEGYSGTFKPQQANQWEGGVKAEILSGRLSVTASYYDIKVKNMTRTDVVTNSEGASVSVTLQDGTQTSRGYEVEVIANPANGLNLIAGYSYNYSKLTQGVAALKDRRPASAGPGNLANLWLSYTQPSGHLKGLGVGAGGNYVGKYMTGNSEIMGIFTNPSYTLLNATVYYDAAKFRLGFKVDNITDELYFVGQGVLSPQSPRNYAATLAFKF